MTPRTPDDRYFVVNAQLWRCSNPSLRDEDRQRLVDKLMEARRAVRGAKASNDLDLLRSQALPLRDTAAPTPRNRQHPIAKQSTTTRARHSVNQALRYGQANRSFAAPASKRHAPMLKLRPRFLQHLLPQPQPVSHGDYATPNSFSSCACSQVLSSSTGSVLYDCSESKM